MSDQQNPGIRQKAQHFAPGLAIYYTPASVKGVSYPSWTLKCSPDYLRDGEPKRKRSSKRAELVKMAYELRDRVALGKPTSVLGKREAEAFELIAVVAGSLGLSVGDAVREWTRAIRILDDGIPPARRVHTTLADVCRFYVEQKFPEQPSGNIVPFQP